MTHVPEPAAPGPPSVAARCAAGERAACVAHAWQCGVGRQGDVEWKSTACAEREQRACDLGDADLCWRLSWRYGDTTADAGVTKDLAREIGLVERACQLGGAADACQQMASRHATGDGVPRDVSRAVALWEGLCDEEGGLWPEPCRQLADHLVTGTGIARDEARAARIFGATCIHGWCAEKELRRLCADAGSGATTNVGCVALARTITMPVAGAPPMQPRLARTLLERACQRGEAEGCSHLAAWYGTGRAWPDGSSVPEDGARAEALRKKACALDPRFCDPR